MSLALAHFAVGSALTVLAVAYLVPNAPSPRLLALLGGVWGMVPDAHWISPAFAPELRALHDAPVANAFWFHRALDVADPADSPRIAALSLAGLVVATGLAERRQYRAVARLRTRTENE